MNLYVILAVLSIVFSLELHTADGTKFAINHHGYMKMSSVGVPLEFILEEISPGKNILKIWNSDKALDINGGVGGKDLIIRPVHSKVSQQFSIQRAPNGLSYIVNEGKCLEVEGNRFVMKQTCSPLKDGQKFSIVQPWSGKFPEEDHKEKVKNPIIPVDSSPQIIIVKEGDSHGYRPHRSYSHGSHPHLHSTRSHLEHIMA